MPFLLFLASKYASASRYHFFIGTKSLSLERSFEVCKQIKNRPTYTQNFLQRDSCQMRICVFSYCRVWGIFLDFLIYFSYLFQVAEDCGLVCQVLILLYFCANCTLPIVLNDNSRGLMNVMIWIRLLMTYPQNKTLKTSFGCSDQWRHLGHKHLKILSLRFFGLLSSSLLLFPQRLGRYVLRPSSGVCRPKRCGNNNKDEDNSPKNLNDKNQQASSQKFRQLSLKMFLGISVTFLFYLNSQQFMSNISFQFLNFSGVRT